MIITYGLISRELYRGIQFELSQNKETTGEIPLKSNPNGLKLPVQIYWTSSGDGNRFVIFLTSQRGASLKGSG